MPELPDLQVFSRNLHKTLAGKVIRKVKVPDNKKSESVNIKELQIAIEGQVLLTVFREGKQLRFIFKNGRVLGIHMMLRGQLFLFDKKNDQKNTIIEIYFTDNSGLALTDPQRKATISLDPKESDAPDALSTRVNVKYLHDSVSNKKAPIKKVLLDQTIIRGIGNAYADEILWNAGISPFSIACNIPPHKINDLNKSIKKVLKDAEKQLAQLHPGIITGEYREFLVIHNSAKKKSPTGAPIVQEIKGRTKTYFTKEQERY